MEYLIHTDGGARGNPGIAGAGIIIEDEHGHLIIRLSKYLGRRTNNVAEYEALILALETLGDLVPEGERANTSILVQLDSELIARHMLGEYRVRHPSMKECYARLVLLIARFGKVSFEHIAREKNSEADALANEAMDRGI